MYTTYTPGLKWSVNIVNMGEHRVDVVCWKHYVCVCGTCIRPSQKRVEYRAETAGKIGPREHELTV